MRPGKKFISTVLPALFCTMALLLAACGGGGSSTTTNSPHSKAAANKQVFILPEAGIPDIATFDPGLSTDVPSVNAINLVFTGLVEPDDNGNIVGYLAQSWDVSADHMTYTFHLRPNLKFSDGTPLTSADVAYSIDRALQPATKSGTGPYYLRYVKDSDKLSAGSIKTIIGDSIKTPDQSTVIIVANKPIPFFLKALSYPCSYVLEKSLVDKYGTSFTDHLTAGGGDGPFKVAEYTHSKRIVFVPNPTYYGPHPQLQKLIFPFYKVQDTTYNAYLSGETDWGVIPISDYSTAKSRSDFHSVPQLWINYYAMNYLSKPFDNINIRQAFELAINKDLIVQAAWKGEYIPTNHIVPQGLLGYNANLTGPDGTTSTKGNSAKAKQLLQTGMQQEGWTSVSQIPPITLTYASTGVAASKNEVSILQQEWQSVLGVSVKTEDIDFNKLLTDITGTTNTNTLQFWGIAWVTDYNDPQDWTTLQFDKGSGNNNMNYGQNHSTDAAQQQQVQTMLEQADVNQDQTSRLQAYNQAEQKLVNDVAWLPMEQVTATYLLKPCVQGYVLDHQDLTPPNDWGNVFISTDTPCANTSGQ